MAASLSHSRSKRVALTGKTSVTGQNEWPEPQPIRPALIRVPPLAPTLIPEPYRAWNEDVALRLQCPIEFVAAAAIVMTAAVVGAGCGIKPKRHDDWLVIPNLWGGIVGRPGMLKSPAIAEAFRPLEHLEAEARARFEHESKIYEAQLELYRAQRGSLKRDMALMTERKATLGPDHFPQRFSELQEPHPAVWRRYKTNDATIEKMSALLAENPRGLLLVRDELTGLLRCWKREGPDRSFYLEAWNGCGSLTSDRIRRGTIHAENLCVSIFGSIQPARLQDYLQQAIRGNDNDGLIQRFQLLVYPDELSRWKLMDQYPDSIARERVFQIVRKLAYMDFLQYGALFEDGAKVSYFRFENAAQERFFQWWSELENGTLRREEHPMLLEHLAKYRSLMPSLALLFHLIDVAAERHAGPVTLQAAEMAVGWCELLVAHAQRVYGTVTDSRAPAVVQLARRLSAGALGARFRLRDVYRKEWELLNTKARAQAACQELIQAHWLREAPRLRGVHNGRPSIQYEVNAKIMKRTRQN
jgi:putative DNA primase/helicase